MTQGVLKYAKGDKLFHSKHGLCRVKEITRQSGMKGYEVCYCLEPVKSHHANPRFVVSVERIQQLGFHVPMTQRNVMKVIARLKKPGPNLAMPKEDRLQLVQASVKEGTPAGFAEVLILLYRIGEENMSHEERKAFQRSAEALVRELVYVLKIPGRKASGLVLKNLGPSTSPWARKVIRTVEPDEEK